MVSRDVVKKQYVDWLKFHEAAHLIFDDVVNICRRTLNATDYDAYNIESERFAILSQMTFSDLHAYTLFNFFSALENVNYNVVVSSILDDLFVMIKSNRNLFSSSILHNITEKDISSLALLSNEQIGNVSRLLFNKTYEKVLMYKGKLDWFSDPNKERIIFLDSQDIPINDSTD